MTELPNETARTDDFEFEALRLAKNYRRALVREFAGHLRGRVLEVGCGIGQMTSLLRKLPSIKRLQCVEPSPAFCAGFSRAHPEVPLLHGTAADVPDGADWDAIISINVLEHIREHEAELERYRRLLETGGGRLCLFVPARPEIFAPIDADFGHHRRYTRDGLRDLLAGAGFELERLDYFNSLGYLAWWFAFCLLKRRHFESRSVLLYDRAIFPAVHALESGVMRPPLGQSLIAVPACWACNTCCAARVVIC